MKDEINVIDAGARYGVHPNIAAIRCNRNIYAFEPESREFAYLQQKYSHDKSYYPFRIALSDKTAKLELKITSHQGCATLSEINNESIFFSRLRKSEGNIEEVQSVEADTIDNLIHENVVANGPDLIKADVEGHEIRLLEGATHALKTCLSVSIEMLFDNTYSKQTAAGIVGILVDNFDFALLGFDYDGKGMPIHHLGHSRNAGQGKGVITGINGYFTKNETYYDEIKDLDEQRYSIIKASILAFGFGYDDFAFYLLDKYWPSGALAAEANLKFPGLCRCLKFNILNAIYRLKTDNLMLFEEGKRFFRDKYQENFPDKHEYFRYLESL